MKKQFSAWLKFYMFKKQLHNINAVFHLWFAWHKLIERSECVTCLETQIYMLARFCGSEWHTISSWGSQEGVFWNERYDLMSLKVVEAYQWLVMIIFLCLFNLVIILNCFFFLNFYLKVATMLAYVYTRDSVFWTLMFVFFFYT